MLTLSMLDAAVWATGRQQVSEVPMGDIRVSSLTFTGQFLI